MKLFIYILILIFVFACQNENKRETEGVAENSETTKLITDSFLSSPISGIRIQVNADSAQTNEEDRFFENNVEYIVDTSTIIVTQSICNVPYTCYAGESSEETQERELRELKEIQRNLNLLSEEDPKRELEENQRILGLFGTECGFDFYINCIDSIELLYLEFPIFGYTYKFITKEKTQVWLSNRDRVWLTIVNGVIHDTLSATVSNKKKRESLYLIKNSITNSSFHDDYIRSEIYFNFHIVVNGKRRIETFKLKEWNQV